MKEHWKAYIGDSVYVARWDQGIVLTTENGIGASNTIYLEPYVVLELIRLLIDRGNVTIKGDRLCRSNGEQKKE